MSSIPTIKVLPSARNDREQHFKNLNRMQNEAGCYADWTIQRGDVWEIDEETYHEFLGILPPLAYKNNSFCMSEMLTEDVTPAFFQAKDRFFCGYIRLGAYRDDMKAIEDAAYGIA